jgi:hypothetical protein
MSSHDEEGTPAACFICHGRICSGQLIAQCHTCSAMVFHRACGEQARRHAGHLKCACSKNLLDLLSVQPPNVYVRAAFLLLMYRAELSLNIMLACTVLFYVMAAFVQQCIIFGLHHHEAIEMTLYLNGTAVCNNLTAIFNESSLHIHP